MSAVRYTYKCEAVPSGIHIEDHLNMRGEDGWQVASLNWTTSGFYYVVFMKEVKDVR